jgi:hypothetical protein
MNRFVYLVHTDYRDPAERAATPIRQQQDLSEKVVRLPFELRRYLPDTQARILGESIRRGPDVIRVTVMTSLDEATADAAFVRFIRDCNAAMCRERLQTN